MSPNQGFTTGLDPEIKECVLYLQKQGLKTVASCSGHKIYHKTIFIKDKLGYFWEWFSKIVIIPVKRRYLCFYQRDKKGYYFNAEIEVYYQKDVVK